MAVSAFKSTSKRGNISSTSTGKERIDHSPKKVPPRRSRSVSTLSRAQLEPPPSSSQSTTVLDFLNKRDNPLFWSGTSPPSSESAKGITKFDESSCESALVKQDNRRGRSVLRNSDVIEAQSSSSRKIIGRSLSQVRGRSVSRGHYGTSESEVERECNLLPNHRHNGKTNSKLAHHMDKKSNLVRGSTDLDLTKCLRTWSSQHPPSDPSDLSAVSMISNLEDGLSTESISEAEEKTIKAVYEQMKSSQGNCSCGDTSSSGIYETVRSEVRRAISDIQKDLETVMQRNSAAFTATTKVADIPSDLVKPGAVEVVLDIRKDYSRKLEQSQERARKLRADLAVEEHRGQELRKILKEILPDPKPLNVRKSRPARKTSIERQKMSERLAEEAMAYFDECVSISTFDSDFSSQEDPPHNLCGPAVSLPQRSPSLSTTNCSNSCLDNRQESGGPARPSQSQEGFGSAENNNSHGSTALNHANEEGGQKCLFSFSSSPKVSFEIQQDIRKYVKIFEKNIEKEGESGSHTVGLNHYDIEEYNQRLPAESLFLDRMLFKNRVDSSGLLLCSGGNSFAVSPFGSIV